MGQGGDAFGDAVCDFGWHFYLAAVVVYKDQVAVLDTAGSSVFRMNLELLGVQLAKSGIIVVDGVAAGFGMPAGQLQRILPGQWVFGPFGRRHISGDRRYKVLKGRVP